MALWESPTFELCVLRIRYQHSHWFRNNVAPSDLRVHGTAAVWAWLAAYV